MLGGIFVKLAFLTCLVAVAAFYDNHRRGNAAALRLARIAGKALRGKIVRCKRAHYSVVFRCEKTRQ